MSYEPREHGARCDDCPLGGKNREFCPPAAPASGKVKLVIVGEGPGHRELREKRPFIGKSGLLLDRTFREQGGERLRESAWVTNAALCRGETDNEKDEAAACCAPRLYKEIAALPAKAPVLALGKPAVRSILGMSRILKTRGFVWKTPEIPETSIRAAEKNLEKLKKSKKKKTQEDAERATLLSLRLETLKGRSKIAGRTIFPTIHPAHVLRNDILLPLLEVDVNRFVRYMKALFANKPFPLADESGTYKVLFEAKKIRKALSTMSPTVSFDIETVGVDPMQAEILCASVSGNKGRDTIVIQPWQPKVHAPLLTEAFSSRKPGGHNVFAFDMIAMKRDGVKFPGLDAMWDSLLAHHAYASHFPQSLDQVVSFYLDSGPWKIKFGRKGAEEKGILPAQMTPEDRAHYNAVDSRSNLLAWWAMKPDLKPEAKIYKIDKQNALMCQSMQEVGIQVDLEKRAWLSKALKRRASRMLRRMRLLTRRPNFHPNRTIDIRKALFGQFKAPSLTTTPTGLQSTSVIVLNSLATQQTRAGKLSRYILKYRKAHKIRSTYVDSIETDKAGRVHYSWKAFGTISGRWSCRFMTLPRVTNPKKPALEDRVRELYTCRPGYCIVYFDLSQAEMRVAANLSGDENFMAVCLQKDVHSANAVIIFPEAAELIKNDPKGKGKIFRDIAKNCGFAVNYLAGEETLFLTIQKNTQRPISMKVVRAMLQKLHLEFRTHFKYIDNNVEFCKIHGYLRTPISGRIRWMGWAPKAAEVANLPVQGTVADIMNERLWEIFGKLPNGVSLIAQIHDAAAFECPLEQVEPLKGLIKEVMGRPVAVPGTDRQFVIPIDLKVGQRMSEVA